LMVAYFFWATLYMPFTLRKRLFLNELIGAAAPSF